jgi:hypothetical protein
MHGDQAAEAPFEVLDLQHRRKGPAFMTISKGTRLGTCAPGRRFFSLLPLRYRIAT